MIIHKNGIEFRSPTPFSEWTEMTMTLQSPGDGGRVHCTGVVISCTGNKHTGYHVSMVFTGLSKQAQARLTSDGLHCRLGSQLSIKPIRVHWRLNPGCWSETAP